MLLKALFPPFFSPDNNNNDEEMKKLRVDKRNKALLLMSLLCKMILDNN
jgi:hypothetical protein